MQTHTWYSVPSENNEALFSAPDWAHLSFVFELEFLKCRYYLENIPAFWRKNKRNQKV